MDFRRNFGFRAPRPVGDSTILVPQLENYSLFATPFLDLRKKIDKLIDEEKQDVKSQSEEGTTTKTTRKGATTTQKKKEDDQKLSKEAIQDGSDFGIVLNVVTVKPEQLFITFGEGNEIKVKVVQDNVKSEYGSIPFSRNCTYKYELPDGVEKNSLVALYTSDDYLIILPSAHLRKDLLEKSIRVREKPAESSDKDVNSLEKVTESTDLDEKAESIPETSKSKVIKPKKISKSEEGIEKTKPKKPSDKVEDSSKSDSVFFEENCSIPIHPVTRILRPGLDIFMLRKYMIDLESYVSTARKFIENASFLSQNSKTAERCIRFLAKTHADKFYEEANLKGDGRRRIKIRKPSHTPDSGYTSYPDLSDESSKRNLAESNPNLASMLAVPIKE